MTGDVEELLVRFEEHLERLALAPITIVNYLADLRTFARWHTWRRSSRVNAAEDSLLRLTPEDIRAYRRYMQTSEGWAPSTINRRLQAVRKFYSFAMETGRTESNPASQVRLVAKPNSNPPRALEPTEVARLLEAVQQEGRPSLVKRDYAIIQLFLQTGVKLGELTELRLSDVQLHGNGEGVLLVGGGEAVSGESPHHGDGGTSEAHWRLPAKRRRVPLNSQACAAVRDYLQVRAASNSTDSLFLSRRGNCISKRTVQRLIHVYTQAAGLEDVSARVLRHTYLCCKGNGVGPGG